MKNIPGAGVQARTTAGERELFLGNLKLMQQSEQQVPADLEAQIQSVISAARPLALLAWNGRVQGLFVFSEQLRPAAREMLRAAQQLKLNCVVLTGDYANRGKRLAEELQVPVHAELLPEDKANYVSAAQLNGQSVALVGDGINDAAAMSQAEVGIAMACGADVTREAADVCLIGDRLSLVPWSIRLARRTVFVIKQNLCWAFGYNLIGVAVAMTGYLHPALAAVLMVVSSVFVISNSLRLNHFEFREPGAESDGHAGSVSETHHQTDSRHALSANHSQVEQQKEYV